MSLNQQLNKVALEYRTTKSKKLENKFASLLIQRCKHIIFKTAVKYSTYNTGDEDLILTNLYVRVSNNIDKWEPTSCAFTTWVYSCAVNETRGYYTKENVTLTRYKPTENITHNVTYTISNKTEKYTYEIYDTDAILLFDYPMNGHYINWHIVYNGKVLCTADRQVALDKYIFQKEKIGNHVVVNRQSGKKRNRPIYRIKLAPKYAVKRTIVFDTEDELIEFKKEYQTDIIKCYTNKVTDDKHKDFMNDYYSGDYSYKDLMVKYDTSMQNVKNYIHTNKKQLKQFVENEINN